MAQAKLNFKTETRTEERRVVTEVKTEAPESVTLTLTLDEARLVRSLVGHTGGGGFLRELVNSVYTALGDIGVGVFNSSSFKQTPNVKTLNKAPEVWGDVIPQPKETREDLCGSTSVKPELRVGALIRITNPWVNSPYVAGQEFIVRGVSATKGAYFFDSYGEHRYAAWDEFEVIG